MVVVVVVVTIIKVNGHTRVDAEDAEHVRYFARLKDHGNPPHAIYSVEDKFYETEFYAKFLAEQKTQLH